MTRSVPGRAVEVSHGSAWSRSLDTPLFLITEARFAPGALLEPHTHPRPICALMLNGSFDTRVGSRDLDCRRGTVWTEPCEERHLNRTGSGGAHVLVIQPDPARADVFGPVAGFLDGVHELPRAGLIPQAGSVLRELRRPDTLSSLGIDAHLLAMLVRVARMALRRDEDRRPPPWLEKARDYVNAEFRTLPRLEDIARAVDAPPTELAPAFRARFGRSLADYARELRVEWAVDRLHATDQSIAAIAVAAGYSDQSHFTRDCVSRLGVTPGRLRRDRGTV